MTKKKRGIIVGEKVLGNKVRWCLEYKLGIGYYRVWFFFFLRVKIEYVGIVSRVRIWWRKDGVFFFW